MLLLWFIFTNLLWFVICLVINRNWAKKCNLINDMWYKKSYDMLNEFIKHGDGEFKDIDYE